MYDIWYLVVIVITYIVYISYVIQIIYLLIVYAWVLTLKKYTPQYWSMSFTFSDTDR